MLFVYCFVAQVSSHLSVFRVAVNYSRQMLYAIRIKLFAHISPNFVTQRFPHFVKCKKCISFKISMKEHFYQIQCVSVMHCFNVINGCCPYLLYLIDLHVIHCRFKLVLINYKLIDLQMNDNRSYSVRKNFNFDVLAIQRISIQC